MSSMTMLIFSHMRRHAEANTARSQWKRTRSCLFGAFAFLNPLLPISVTKAGSSHSGGADNKPPPPPPFLSFLLLLLPATRRSISHSYDPHNTRHECGVLRISHKLDQHLFLVTSIQATAAPSPLEAVHTLHFLPPTTPPFAPFSTFSH